MLLKILILELIKKQKNSFSKKGIRTKLIRTKKYSKFYRSYFINKKLFIPFVSAKIAISKDYLTIKKKKMDNKRSIKGKSSFIKK